MKGSYYNEIDPYAAQWLRNLIAAGHIAPGDVDERSIIEVQLDDLKGYAQCHFFAGVGVWSYALRLAGWPDDRPCWTGSCPCQPFSAGGLGKGIEDERHLWPDWFRLIGEQRPDPCFGEQIASRDGLAWLDFVCADLEGAGYAVGAINTNAAAYEAPHERQRLYFVAHPMRQGRKGYERIQCISGGSASTLAKPSNCFARARRSVAGDTDHLLLEHGLTVGVGRERLRAYGNSLCAPQAEAFIRAYQDCQ